MFPSAATCLHNLKEGEYNPGKIVAKLKAIDDLVSETTELKGELSRVTASLEVMKSRVKEASEELRPKSEDLLEAKKLSALQIDLGGLARIRKTVVSISERKKIGARAALAHFTEDILKNYDPVLGLEAKIRKLREDEGEINHNIESAKKHLSLIEVEHKSRKWEIEAYVNLLGKGVSDQTLLELNEAIETTGLDARVVRNELVKHGKLQDIRDDLNDETEQARKRRGKLNSEVASLEDRKEELIASIRTVKDDGITQLKAVKRAFDQTLREIGKQQANRLGEASTSMNTQVDSFRSSIHDTVEKATTSFDALTKKSDEARLTVENLGRALDAVTEIRGYLPLTVLYDLLNGDPGLPTYEVLSTMSALVKNFRAWASDRDLKQKDALLDAAGKFDVQIGMAVMEPK